MEKFSAQRFYQTGMFLGGLRQLLLGWKTPDKIFTAGMDTDKSTLRDAVMGIRANCKAIGLGVSIKSIDDMVGTLKQGKSTIAEFVEMLRVIEKTIAWEMEDQMFFHVPARRAERYTKATLAFGEEVNDAFPKAIVDIEEASKCLALSRGTACVFHSMRVMEAGLKAVAKLLDIPYAPSWESYIKQIDNRVGENYKKKPRSWKRTEPFFKEVLGDLQAVKIAWRNPTMHIVRTYTPEEAEQIFGAVKIFMQRVAPRLKKKTVVKVSQYHLP